MPQHFDPLQWEKLLDQSIAQIRFLSKLKGGEYAGDQDRLANFRRNALALGLPMETIWGVYAGKHWDAIQQYIKDNQQNKNRVRLEPIEGRVDDLLVYLLLFKAMLWEEQGDVYTALAGDLPVNDQQIKETIGQEPPVPRNGATAFSLPDPCPICRGPMVRGVLHQCISGQSNA